jgi:hypothetical protein
MHYRDDLIILDVTFIQGRPKLRDTRRNHLIRPRRGSVPTRSRGKEEHLFRLLPHRQIRRVGTGIRMPSAFM